MTDAPSPLTVTRATSAHAEALARLHAQSFTQMLDSHHVPSQSPVRLSLEQAMRDQWEHTLQDTAPAGSTFAALHGTETVGFMACIQAPAPLPIPGEREIPAGVEIQTLTVHGDFRRSGHASRLLAALMDTLHPASVRVWIGSDDEDLVRFYRGAGFAPSGLRRSFHMGEEPDAPVRTEHLWWTRVEDAEDAASQQREE